MRQHLDAALLEQRHQLAVVDLVLQVDQAVHMLRDRGIAVHGRRTTLLVAQARAQVRLEADLEELVEVGRDDGQIAQPFEQWHLGPARPVQHALVEGQDALVTIQERNAGHGGGNCHDCLASFRKNLALSPDLMPDMMKK